MSTDLILVDQGIEPYMTWLDTVPAEIRKIKKSDISSAMKILRQVELLEVGSRKMKIHDLTKKAAVTKLTLMREIGQQLDKLFGTKIAEADYEKYNLTKSDVFRYRQIGTIPEYQWKRLLDKHPVVSEALREAKRYADIKGLLETSGLRNKNELLKDYILDGLPTETVLSRLRAEGKLKTDKQWVGADEEDDVEVFETEEPVDPVKDKKTQDNIFITEFIKNAETVAESLSNEARTIAAITDCSERQFRAMRKATTKIRDALINVVESLRGLIPEGEVND